MKPPRFCAARAAGCTATPTACPSSRESPANRFCARKPASRDGLPYSQRSGTVPCMRTAKREASRMMTKITIRLPDALVQRAKIRAVRQRTQLQKIIAAALEAWLKHPDRDQGGETR